MFCFCCCSHINSQFNAVRGSIDRRQHNGWGLSSVVRRLRETSESPRSHHVDTITLPLTKTHHSPLNTRLLRCVDCSAHVYFTSATHHGWLVDRGGIVSSNTPATCRACLKDTTAIFPGSLFCESEALHPMTCLYHLRGRMWTSFWSISETHVSSIITTVPQDSGISLAQHSSRYIYVNCGFAE